MKRITTAAAAAVLALTSLTGAAFAQPGPDHWDNHGGPPPGHEHWDNRGGPPGGPPGHAYGHWRKGDRVDRGEWRRYDRVDWRRHHLRAPPRGYEWREVNGQYVLAAAATGLIAAIIANQ